VKGTRYILSLAVDAVWETLLMVDLKKWLGKQAGPSAYGNQMGNAAVENGTILGRTLYASHGVKVDARAAYIFDGFEDMKLSGFELYSSLNTGYTSGVLVQSIGACIAFSARLATNAAWKFFRHSSNKQDFVLWTGRAVGMTLKKETGELPQVTQRYADFLFGLPDGEQFVNSNRPGDGDVFSRCLHEIGRNNAETCAIGFPRSVFGELITDFADQTTLGVSSAAMQFDW
jgi:hypothetical protein